MPRDLLLFISMSDGTQNVLICSLTCWEKCGIHKLLHIVCLNRGAREKCEYEEFGGHTHLIYLTYPVTQEQTLPLGYKKKSQPHTSLCQICFPFFSLALFFSLWLCSSKLAERWSSAVESSESWRIFNYQGTPSFYVRVHSRPVQGNNILVLYKSLVMWRGCTVWCVCIFISTSWNNFSAFQQQTVWFNLCWFSDFGPETLNIYRSPI